MPNLSKTNQSFRKIFFRIFVPLKETLVAIFSETRALTFRKYVAGQCVLMPNLSEKKKSFSLQSSVFALERML